MILVIEDNPITLRMLRVALEAERYAVQEARDGRTALALCETQQPALVVQDFVLPDMSGLAVATRIRAMPWGREVPLVLLAGLTDQAAVWRASGLFASVLRKPVQGSRLVAVVRSLLAPPEVTASASPRRVLLVDDDPTNRKLAQVRLEHAGHTVTVAAAADAALTQARHERPDVILADVLMPGLDGFQFCLAVRGDPLLADIPIVLVSSAYNDEADRRLALQAGAAALVPRTPDYGEAMVAIERAVASGAPSLASGRPELPPEYLATLRRQMDRQLADNQRLAERTSIQAAALCVIGALAHALAKPHEIASQLGDILIHCLEAVGLSTGILYLRQPDGSVRLNVVTGLPDAAHAEATGAFGHPELLAPGPDGEPRALSRATDDPAAVDFLSRFGHASALVVPFVVVGRHYGSLVLGSDEHDLADDAWRTFGRALAAQFGQAVALGETTAALADSEELIRRAVDASPRGMITIDGEGRIVMVNRQVEQIFGYRGEELIGRPVDDLLPERLRGLHSLSRVAFPADPSARPMGAGRELLGLHQSGREVPVEIGLAPVARGTDTFVIASVIDITERKEAQQALRDREERFRQLADNITEVFFIMSAGITETLYINPAYEKMWGRSCLSLYQNPRSFVDAVAPDDQPLLMASMARTQLGEDAGEIEFRVIRPDGQVRLLLAHAVPVRDERGEVYRISGVAVDITEKRALEKQFQQAQKMEAVGLLAAGVAHDFNNLLTVITTYTHLMLDDLAPGDPRREDLDQIRQAAVGATGLTRQLLAFSRQQVIEPRLLTLEQVVTGAGKLLTRLIGEDVELVIRLTDQPATVRIDPGQLEQVIMNLAVNARDAMPTGGKLTIETHTVELDETYAQAHFPATSGRFAMLAVSDTGVGMDDATRARIFEPFFTTKEPGRGTGLGLSTVDGIVKQSGGFIQVDSEPGVGTSFKIYLPSVDEPAGQLPIVASSLRCTGTETILLVEDSPAVSGAARNILNRCGYVVLEAKSAVAALALAATHKGPIHLLLTDVVMPGMSGRELGDQFRAIRPEAKVLFMSGYTNDAVLRHGVLASGIAFLQKPFSPDALATKVRGVLDSGSPPSNGKHVTGA